MGYKAVFCDIDGTLLDNEHRVRPDTAAFVRALHEGGTPFILVSARGPAGLRPIRRELGIRAPVVCFGGALILDGDGAPIHSLGLDMGRVVALKKRVRALWPGVATSVYVNDDWLVDDAGDSRFAVEKKLTGREPMQIAVDDLPAYADEAHRLLCIGGEDEVRDMEERLPGECPDLAVVRSFPIFLELLNAAATKANALRYLCRTLGVSVDEAVAFGDNYNDLDMIEVAGLGVAMGNAPGAVKAKADLVAEDNDHEGVMLALKTLSFEPVAG